MECDRHGWGEEKNQTPLLAALEHRFKRVNEGGEQLRLKTNLSHNY